MKRFMGIAAGMVALGAVLAGCLPPPPAPPPPPPPPKFKLAAGLWHTLGTAPGAKECYFVRKDGEGKPIPGSEEHSATGQRYVQTEANDSEFVTSGCQPWILSGSAGDTQHFGVYSYPFPEHSTGFHQMLGDGDYRIAPTYDFQLTTGDIPFGTYQLNNGTSCHWQVLRNFTGNYFSVWNQGDGTGDGRWNGVAVPTVSVPAGGSITGLRVSGCGSPPPFGNWMYWYGTPLYPN